MKIRIALFAVLVGLFAGSSVTADEPVRVAAAESAAAPKPVRKARTTSKPVRSNASSSAERPPERPEFPARQSSQKASCSCGMLDTNGANYHEQIIIVESPAAWP